MKAGISSCNGWNALSGRIRIITVTSFLLMSMDVYQPSASPDYQVKAVFLFNFTQFVEWPERAFPDLSTPWMIGILGTDPFGNFLDNTVMGEKINGRDVFVRRYASVEEAKSCHILFVNVTKSNQLAVVMEELKGRDILTVGENANFIRLGGMIRFTEENRKIALQINPDAAMAADLVISSKLLRLAEIVSAK